MAVEGIIFDVSDTLLTKSGQAVAGVTPALIQLRNLGVKIIAANNNGPKAKVERDLARAGITVDHVVTRNEVGIAKGSDKWIKFIKQETGLATKQLLYVGDSQLDMITASHGHVVYIHAGWAAARSPYGIFAPTPGWVAAIVEHIFRKKHTWWWKVDQLTKTGHRIRQMALIDGNGAGSPEVKDALITLLKRDGNPQLGLMTVGAFTMLHLIASIYEEGLTEEVNWWTVYPGHDGSANPTMAQFLDVGAKLFRDKYQAELLVRHTPALRSAKVRLQMGTGEAIKNQLTTMQINPGVRDSLPQKKILLVDDFITQGLTTEVGRNLLMTGGAAEVITVAIGKYGQSVTLLNLEQTAACPWTPFAPLPECVPFLPVDRIGTVDAEALAEFVASYMAIQAVQW